MNDRGKLTNRSDGSALAASRSAFFAHLAPLHFCPCLTVELVKVAEYVSES